jgi:hypothetical protein
MPEWNRVRKPQDLIAVIAFPVSFVSFIVWEYLRSTLKNSQREKK